VNGTETFEEKISRSLNALSDGARLLTGSAGRADSLVLSVVVDASRVYARSEVDGDFSKWIVGRMVKQYLDYVDETDGWPENEPVSSPDAPERFAPSSESDVDAMLQGMSNLETGDSDRLGQMIRAAMQQLGLLERTVLWLVNVMDFSYAETAGVLALNPIEVRDTLLRARRELQARLAIALQRELSRADSKPEWEGLGGG
jgi:DNA-directed RNA polymerase specialized sigma24 family protein